MLYSFLFVTGKHDVIRVTTRDRVDLYSFPNEALQRFAAIINDKFPSKGDIYTGVEFGHGNGVNMLNLLEAMGRIDVTMVGIEVT